MLDFDYNRLWQNSVVIHGQVETKHFGVKYV